MSIDTTPLLSLTTNDAWDEYSKNGNGDLTTLAGRIAPYEWRRAAAWLLYRSNEHGVIDRSLVDQISGQVVAWVNKNTTSRSAVQFMEALRMQAAMDDQTAERERQAEELAERNRRRADAARAALEQAEAEATIQAAAVQDAAEVFRNVTFPRIQILATAVPNEELEPDF